VPSHITIPILLKRIRKANPDIKIKILIATGAHRAPTKKEMLNKFGEKVVQNETILVHDSKDNDTLVKIDKLPSGGDLVLNRHAIETDLLIAEGFIEPHFFAGFSGGRKSILPGIAGYDTVLANHCAEFIDSPYARTGILENNPIHKDMIYAARAANLKFILNVIINSNKELIRACSGHIAKAHEQGCQFVLEQARSSSKPADITITSNGGYPLDQNIYQSVKGMTAGEAACKSGGVIIMVAACSDGHGGESFYRQMAEAKSPARVLAKTLRRDRDETIPEQWEYQILSRILNKHTVIMVTDMCHPELIKNMHMEHARNIEEALKKAYQITGPDPKINLIPNGVSVIIDKIKE
jgi:nickel-dependent lactate racemase